ncbi:MAG TPA: 30S ribosomal protein S2 [Candidatus Paceibacterota bacterium]
MEDIKTIIDSELEDSKSQEPEQVLTPEEEVMLKDMMANHVFYGYSKSRTNPKMKPNIAMTKSGVEVIDAVKTMFFLNKAVDAIKQLVHGGDLVLLVGTSTAAKSTVKEIATRLQMPYVDERWLGGTLTNFKTISDRINYFKKLEQEKALGKLAQKYTKKEQLGIDVELEKFDKFFRGIENLNKLPKLVVIADTKYNEIAAKEAKKMKIKTMGIINTNSDPDIVDYPIPANDRNSKSIAFIMSYLEKFIAEAKNNFPKDKVKEGDKLEGKELNKQLKS